MMQSECQCAHCKELRRQRIRAYKRHEKLLKIKQKHEKKNYGAGTSMC